MQQIGKTIEKFQSGLLEFLVVYCQFQAAGQCLKIDYISPMNRSDITDIYICTCNVC